MRLSFIVNRPAEEPGFRLERSRRSRAECIRYTVQRRARSADTARGVMRMNAALHNTAIPESAAAVDLRRCWRSRTSAMCLEQLDRDLSVSRR